MTFKRSDRVSELLRHEISQLVQEINDPRLGFVTITSVRISEDLMDAKVSFSVLGTEEERELSSKILRAQVPRMRHKLGRKLESLRRVPTVEFVYDESPLRAQKIVSILNQLTLERESTKQSPGPDSQNLNDNKRKNNSSTSEQKKKR